MKTLSPLFAALLLVLASCETAPAPAPAPAPAKETLLDLVENQNLDKIRDIFGLNQDVNSVNAQGQSALHLAASKDLADIAAVLLARGATVDLPDRQGNTALHLAVKNGSVTVLPLLAQYGASLFSVDSQGKSVLQTALQQNPDLIPKLVTRATIGNRDAAGNTVLHIAAAQGLEGLVDVLVQLGADQALRNNAGLTALDEALQFPKSLTHAKIAWKLIRQGAPKPKDVTVDYFWQAGASGNPNQTFESGQSALHYAASRGQTGLLRLLVAQGANVNAVDQPGNTPLHRAVENGDLEASALLLDQGADINAKDFNGNTTLHLALTSRSALETVSFLLGKGALPNAKNSFGNTPLHMVVSLGLGPDVAKALAAHGGDVNARNKQGDSPLLDAVKEANQALVTTLLALGANPFAGNNVDESPLTQSIKAGTENLSWLMTASNKDIRDDNGNAALHLAVKLGDYPGAVAYLLSIGSNPNDRNKLGQSPLHLAVLAKNLAVAQGLFKGGADLFLLDTSGLSPLSTVFQTPAFAEGFFTDDVVAARDTSKNTPLFHAVFQGNLPMVQLLLKKGASVKDQNLAGQTPLHEAVRLGNVPVASVLLKGGAGVNVADGQGNTPLHNLVLFDSLDMGELLLANGADLGAKNKDGRTVLHEAVRRNLTKVTVWLLKKGADANSRDAQGRTALFDAVQGANADLAKVLLASGAGVNVRDAGGATVAHLAAGTASQAVVDLLTGAGADLFAENAAGTTPAVIALKGPAEGWKVFFTKKNVNSQNNQGQTVVHLAAVSGVSLAAVQYLVGLGADLQIRNKDGKTAADLAQAAGRTDLLAVLKDRG